MSQKENELIILQKRQREAYRERLVQDSRDHLKKIARKKFRTCFIFALVEFENTFGLNLWGHNLPEDELTPEQKANRIRWEQVRKNILDKGNTQSRALEKEIDLYRVEFEGYHINFGGMNHGNHRNRR